MTSNYKFPIRDSSGTPTSTTADFDDMFVPKDLFLNAGLWLWGNNTAGQLGQGSTTPSARSSPVRVGTLTDWRQIAVGKNNILSLKTNGTLWAWGDNDFGQLGVGDITNRSSPVQVGALTDWNSISTAEDFSSAIKNDGTLWMWGRNSFGQLGHGNTTSYSSPVQVGSLTNWKYISTGRQTAAIKTDGTLWVWGSNDYGQLGLNDRTNRSSPVQVGTETDWKQVDAGIYFHIVAIKNNGTLWAWGGNTFGGLGLNDRTHRSSPVQVGSLTNWKLVSSGFYSTIATKTDGTAWSWGNNQSQVVLGLNDITNRSSPVQIGSLTNWKQVDMGEWTSGGIQSPDLP
jgi:alpha-tubulin suppressor-like RCC1 family protein